MSKRLEEEDYPCYGLMGNYGGLMITRYPDGSFIARPLGAVNTKLNRVSPARSLLVRLTTIELGEDFMD